MSAIQKECSEMWLSEKDTGNNLRPYVLIAVPLAAMRSDEWGRERFRVVARKTLSSAPESMRKYLLDRFSKMDMVDVLKSEPAAAIVNRLWRFPEDDIGPDHTLGTR